MLYHSKTYQGRKHLIRKRTVVVDKRPKAKFHTDYLDPYVSMLLFFKQYIAPQAHIILEKFSVLYHITFQK